MSLSGYEQGLFLFLYFFLIHTDNRSSAYGCAFIVLPSWSKLLDTFCKDEDERLTKDCDVGSALSPTESRLRKVGSLS